VKKFSAIGHISKIVALIITKMNTLSQVITATKRFAKRNIHIFIVNEKKFTNRSLPFWEYVKQLYLGQGFKHS
jgi:hypothetical protein